uniref:EF-hand domain-containing protein n=1 Tax=Mesocestoides corti TaxID=53468 RepID=A0A5K3FVN0_MESCO
LFFYFIHLLSRSKGAQDLFRVADVDQLGKLSLSEIKRLVEVCDYDIDDEELQAIFRRADANNDGELDDNEFVELVKYFIGNK